MSLKISVDCSTSSTGATTRPDKPVNILEFKFLILTISQALLRAGFAPEMVAKMTGHKATRSLNHYDPCLSELQKLDMGVTIALQGPLMRGENIELPGNELKMRAAIVPDKFNGAVGMIDG